MRPVSEWTQDDLQNLIDVGVQESLSLDYKSSLALNNTNACRNELSKDVSAFANSAGGTIVYGIVEQNHLPVSLDGGLDPVALTREWVEQVINSTIKPRIQNITIKQIARPEGRVAYVIDIPQATSLAPHQASDNRYYKRFNFQSVPMEDYEVRDTLRRSSTPDLVIHFAASLNENVQDGFKATVRVSISNESPEPAYYRVVKLLVQEALLTTVPGNFSRIDGSHGIEVDGVLVRLTSLTRNYGIPGELPVFKEQPFSVCEFCMSLPEVDTDYAIGYMVSCPGNIGAKFGKIRRQATGAILLQGFE